MLIINPTGEISLDNNQEKNQWGRVSKRDKNERIIIAAILVVHKREQDRRSTLIDESKIVNRQYIIDDNFHNKKSVFERLGKSTTSQTKPNDEVRIHRDHEQQNKRDHNNQ